MLPAASQPGPSMPGVKDLTAVSGVATKSFSLSFCWPGSLLPAGAGTEPPATTQAAARASQHARRPVRGGTSWGATLVKAEEFVEPPHEGPGRGAGSVIGNVRGL